MGHFLLIGERDGMPWFYHDSLATCQRGQRIALAADQQRHLRQVLRADVGDAVTLFDGRGVVAQGHLTHAAAAQGCQGQDDPAPKASASDEQAAAQSSSVVPGSSAAQRASGRHVQGKRRAGRGRGDAVMIELAQVQTVDEPTPAIDVAAASPKGARLDEMVDQLSQVGSSRLMLIRTERSVVDPRATKLARLGHKAIDAARQCHRAHALSVEAEVRPMDQVLAMDHDLKLLADPRGTSFADVLGGSDHWPVAGRVLLVVGPEGGFTADELAQAEACGLKRWCFGPFVMRIETAAAVGAGMLRAMGASDQL